MEPSIHQSNSYLLKQIIVNFFLLADSNHYDDTGKALVILEHKLTPRSRKVFFEVRNQKLLVIFFIDNLCCNIEEVAFTRGQSELYY